MKQQQHRLQHEVCQGLNNALLAVVQALGAGVPCPDLPCLLLHRVCFCRVLFTSDVLANAITLLILGTGLIRLLVNLPDDHGKEVYLGPKHWLTHVTIAIPAYVFTSLGPLALLLAKPQTYFQHRMIIVTAVRLMRLLMLHLTVAASNSAAAPTIAKIAVARAWEAPNTGLVIVIVQPLAYYMHHMLYLLPWQFAGVFQLASTVGVLHWYGKFPCFLQQAQQAAGVGQHPWQEKASYACTGLQSYAALVRTAVGAPLSDFSANICDSEAVISVLQIFWTLVCLLVVPVVIIHELERWMKLRYQQQQGPDRGTVSSLAGASSSRGAGSSSFDSGSSSVSSGSSSDFISSAWAGIDPQRRSVNTLTLAEMDRLTDCSASAGSTCGHAVMLLLVLVLGLPVLWLVAEFLAEVFEANRDCAAVLGAVH